MIHQITLIVLFSFGSCHLETNNNDLTQTKFTQDTCSYSSKIRNIIHSYINNKDSSIFSNEFLSLFSLARSENYECYFPLKIDDINLYYSLGDSILMNQITFDDRALKLIVDLYLINRNNAELSEYYGYQVLPKAALKDISLFVNILVSKNERDANSCIDKLTEIEDLQKKEILFQLKDKINANNEIIIEKIISKLQE